jgi:hypothetical protein
LKIYFPSRDFFHEHEFELLTKPPTADLIPDITIEAVEVWDTVGSLGIMAVIEDRPADGNDG